MGWGSIAAPLRQRLRSPASRPVVCTAEWNLLLYAVSSEGFPSGQREQTVNLSALPSKVRILPPPPIGNQESEDRTQRRLRSRGRRASRSPADAGCLIPDMRV